MSDISHAKINKLKSSAATVTVVGGHMLQVTPPSDSLEPLQLMLQKQQQKKKQPIRCISCTPEMERKTWSCYYDLYSSKYDTENCKTSNTGHSSHYFTLYTYIRRIPYVYINIYIYIKWGFLMIPQLKSNGLVAIIIRKRKNVHTKLIKYIIYCHDIK